MSDYLAGKLYRGSTEVNHPFGLTLLHNHIYWTDWNTDSVYRADVNTGANVVSMAANLGRPMDIHAYSVIPKQGKAFITYLYGDAWIRIRKPCLKQSIRVWVVP